MEEELWKETEEHANYRVSNLGNMFSKKTAKQISHNHVRGGYKVTYINKKTIYIHRLVARAFIPNDDPIKKVFVYHKDGNKLNNHVNNLEWVTPSENVKHAINTGLISLTKRRVNQIDIQTGAVITTFESLQEANQKTGIDDASIVKCCKKTGRVTAGGYKWEFADINPNEAAIDLTNFVEMKNAPHYLICNDGRIYSKRYKKLMKFQTNADGYNHITINYDGKKKEFLVHRLIAMNFLENNDPLNKTTVNHKDMNKKNNNVSNLEWATNSENILHRYDNQKKK